ncbi:MAG: CRISPR-associated helicase/endonuclease Cas3 [Hydrogenophilales bacterium CG_4_9_14_3_um_filter_59_35]|nr:MAG: CRISPR-associated helicase/endonuclease Cas3 [Hydrogenophilales bacterium CG18_big_fil_WC_8_21_14_2_50_58_12]PIX98606.1 MAG: CRISPR-associated helicase/endonuclease Cas3 [Hydrogenophilales bacterium CG_4_10_14_3_um_filter_58_23]PJB04973.1 MAG: CRISPR-associated helicase/endonuclease Cas3 [Hydrogenophilales bacterium CG_4_9_14_3_um_filter_59_35]
MSEKPVQRPLAHVRQLPDGKWEEHFLDEHLRGVAGLAGEFAKQFDCADWAHLAGLWHDLGKYSTEFQQYIKSVSGYDAEAHLEGAPGRVDHSTAGAIHAMRRLDNRDGRINKYGRILSYLAAGHHAGLPDWSAADTGPKALSNRLDAAQDYLLDRIPAQTIPQEILAQANPMSRPHGGVDGLHLWLRMLFSCLVDADFLDTETFMDGDKAATRSGYRDLPSLLADFDLYMENKSAIAGATPVNVIRADILRQCREKAGLNPGLYALTVPTGGGKTLSGMAFALRHAVQHNKQRIIYVIPYTSIIEQTAGIFREIFGDNVVEHHANLDPEKEDARSRLATENWDAPIIVTTNVQFFESLFAARSSRCRKLHNIVNSVVVLDEAQLLPPEFLQPIADVMNQLASYYGVTFVLSTATQPALGSFQTFGNPAFRGLDNVQEIIDAPDVLYQQLKRVEVSIPDDLQTPRDWESLAAELLQHPSVLCIVSRRDDARELHRLMTVHEEGKDTLHLSALMCGEHRSEVIADIKARLKRNEPVRVISTQLVEAGVDVDFPVVYRALAGLDSIAQAAGRCNREGNQEEMGQVVVFVPPKPAPPGLLRQAAQISVSLLSGSANNVLGRDLAKQFFEHLYVRAPSLDKYGIHDLLTQDARDCQIQFRTVADKFKLIDDSAYQTILVRYGNNDVLLGKLEKEGPQRWLMRKLQRYSVNIPKRLFVQLEKQGDVREIWQGIYVQVGDTLYDKTLGVVIDGNIAPDELAI